MPLVQRASFLTLQVSLLVHRKFGKGHCCSFLVSPMTPALQKTSDRIASQKRQVCCRCVYIFFYPNWLITLCNAWCRSLFSSSASCDACTNNAFHPNQDQIGSHYMYTLSQHFVRVRANFFPHIKGHEKTA